MTMVPAPKLSKPHANANANHLFFYGACGADVMTRFSDGCVAPDDYYNNIDANINTNTPTISSNNNIIAATSNISNAVVGSIATTNYSYHNTSFTFMADEEEHSRTSNTSVNDHHPAAAASSTSFKGRDDDTPTPPPPSDPQQYHRFDNTTTWLQLGLGRPHVNTPSSHQTAQMMHMGDEQGGLMLELNLGGAGGGNTRIIHPLPAVLDSRIQQRPFDFTTSNMFAGGGIGSESPNNGATHFLMTTSHPHQPQSQSYPQQQLLFLSNHHLQQQQHQIGWGFVNQRTSLSAAAASAAAGCSSSISPSSSSSMPPSLPVQGGPGSFLTRPFTPNRSSIDSDFRVINPPPRRPHSGIWFSLQASPHQSKQPYLPQLSKSFLRIKDGRMTVRLVMKYVANKLGLDSESEVEIRCRGQQLLPFLTLQHVRDNIWSPRDAGLTTTVTLVQDSSTTDHLMIFNYGRTTTNNVTPPPSSSNFLAPTST